jgi:hypothetical protein
MNGKSHPKTKLNWHMPEHIMSLYDIDGGMTNKIGIQQAIRPQLNGSSSSV